MKLLCALKSGLYQSSIVGTFLLSLNFLSSASALPPQAASSSFQGTGLHANLALPNLTRLVSPVRLEEWPPPPIALHLPYKDTKKFCILYITTLGDEDGAPSETEILLWEILDRIDHYNTLPKDDVAPGFEKLKKDVRFLLEIVPSYLLRGEPLTVSLAIEALNQLYSLIMGNNARELKALIECDGIALGRLGIWLDYQAVESSGVAEE